MKIATLSGKRSFVPNAVIARVSGSIVKTAATDEVVVISELNPHTIIGASLNSLTSTRASSRRAIAGIRVDITVEEHREAFLLAALVCCRVLKSVRFTIKFAEADEEKKAGDEADIPPHVKQILDTYAPNAEIKNGEIVCETDEQCKDRRTITNPTFMRIVNELQI
ncbi:MAG: hypothetical protein CMK92_04460 [Pseudomonas sp.]|nr:hypothetical protein [Pseudomonas sp.]